MFHTWQLSNHPRSSFLLISNHFRFPEQSKPCGHTQIERWAKPQRHWVERRGDACVRSAGQLCGPSPWRPALSHVSCFDGWHVSKHAGQGSQQACTRASRPFSWRSTAGLGSWRMRSFGAPRLSCPGPGQPRLASSLRLRLNVSCFGFLLWQIASPYSKSSAETKRSSKQASAQPGQDRQLQAHSEIQ